MINCKRCIFYYRMFGVYTVCHSEEPCAWKNYDGRCVDYEAKFPYRQLETLKRYLNYLLPRG